jgi:hypothetical protein
LTDHEDTTSIAELIARGDEQAAYGQLVTRLGWPRGRELTESELPKYLSLVARLATRRGASTLADLAEAAIADLDSPDRLYDLGYALIDAGVPAIAASILWRCLGLVGDSEEVVCELVSALESALAYPDALAVLEEHGNLRARSLLCRYLYAFNAAMAGQLDITRTTLPTIVPESPETEAMRDTIAAILARADRVAGVCPLDARDLRGWHYVLTGGLVSHLSPYGYDEPMHGRYAWLADSLPRIATGIDRLATLARAVDMPCVYAPAGKSNEILAHAVAAKLAIPVAPWPAVGVPAPGLVVIYDLADLPPSEVGRLVQRRPGQIVFAHGAPWTADCPIAPDITTLLYQSIVPPWGASMLVDPATQEITTSEPDGRDAETIAKELAASPGLDESELAPDEPARWNALVERVWPPAAGTRSRLWAGGPVPSSRFS